MDIYRTHSHDERLFINLADETPVKAIFREWLADQFSPDKNREDRRLNNREEFKALRRSWRFFLPLLVANVVAILLLIFLRNIGLLLTMVMFFTLLAIYIFQGLRSARRSVSNRIRSNKSKFLRLKSEALVLLELIPKGTKDEDIIEAFKETEIELKSQNSLDKTVLGFNSKALTLGPLALIALAYLLNLVTSIDPRAFIEGNQRLGSALGYAIAMGMVVALANEFIVTMRTVRSERISQILALAQEIYMSRPKPSAESNQHIPQQAGLGRLAGEPGAASRVSRKPKASVCPCHEETPSPHP